MAQWRMVSEELNSVETLIHEYGYKINIIVSEELNSVETFDRGESVKILSILFQKNLIVWKHEIGIEALALHSEVSEELNSVETRFSYV